MVDEGDEGGTADLVWGVCERGRRSISGVGGAVRGLCRLAEAMDGRGNTAGTRGVLEEESGGSSGVAGGARRPCAVAEAGVPGRICRVGDMGGTDRTFERVGPAAWDVFVYGRAGGIGGAARAVDG